MAPKTERDIRLYGSLRAEKLPRRAPSAEEWERRFWSPRTLAHMRYEYTGKTPDGWGLPSFPEFIGTPAQIDIPIARRIKPSPERRPELYAELQEITNDLLMNEPYNVFYRHMDMLITFEENDKMREVAPTVIARNFVQRDEFAETLYEDKYSQDLIRRFINLRTLCYLETLAEDPKSQLPRLFVEKLFEDGISQYGGLLSYAEEFDRRNAKDSESIDVSGKIKEYMLPRLISEREEDYTAVHDVFLGADRRMMTGILTYSLVRAETPEQMYRIIQKFAPRTGVELIRKNLREYASDSPAFRPKMDVIFDYLGLDEGHEVAVDLGEIYSKSAVDMSTEYNPYNQTQQTDLRVLKEQFQGLRHVVDNGCGNGRVLRPLSEQTGLQVTGFDTYTPAVKALREANQDLDVRVGSWFDIPMADKSVDAGYCLGRSLCHNTTVPDFVRALSEMSRVIKDDGFLIVDLPDPTAGEYKDAIDRTEQIAKERGLFNFLPGTIIDSPDGEHFFDRYVPDDAAFDALASFAGLRAEKLPVTQPYRGANGEVNVNTYWKLTKFPWPLPAYVRVYDYLEKIYGHDLGPNAHPI